MSCPEKNRSFANKPNLTKTMRKKGMSYVWREVMGNPNLYCWIPAFKKNNIENIDIEDINIQDIPPAVIPEDFDDIIASIAEQAVHEKHTSSLKKISKDKSPRALVSVDDPNKYPYVKDFIMAKGLKIYGGVAINSYLPKEEKFYTAYDIPDYDFYSPDPWNHAVELADLLYKKGYKYSEAKAGIHKGTYKVYANLWPVADITYMPQEEFDKMETKTINNLRVVSPFKILESMYKEFSEPYSNPARWPKVATREKLIQKWVNPLNHKFPCSKDLFSQEGQNLISFTLLSLLEIAYTFIAKKDLIFTGPIAYNTYIEIGGGSKRILTNHYRVLSENANEDSQKLFTLLLKAYEHLELTTRYLPSRELNNTTYDIFAIIDNKHHLVCQIIHLTSCTPYLKLLNRTVVSIDYLKYDLFDTSVFGNTKEDVANAKCKLQYLTLIQENYYKSKGINEIDKSPFQRFIIKCRGPFQENIKVEILNQWLEKTVKKDVIKEWSPTHRIRKIPREEIPKECVNREQNNCKYPCAWNKFIGKCTGMPKGSYRPDTFDPDLVYQYK